MEYLIHLLILTSIYALAVLGLELVVGITGIPAFGQAGFMLVGAYTSALLNLKGLLSPPWSIFAGGVGAGLAGTVVFLPVKKLREDYLALATFGAGIIFYHLAKNWLSLTGGPLGLKGLSPLGESIEEESFWIFFFLALVWWSIWKLATSPFGRVLRAIREDEIGAQIIGKNTPLFKFKAFIVGSICGGLAGALYAHYVTFISPDTFRPLDSIILLLMVILGGTGTVHGATLGALLILGIPELLRFLGLPSEVIGPLRQIIYSFLLLILILYKPRGLLEKYRL